MHGSPMLLEFHEEYDGGGNRRRKYSIDPADIVAIGIVVLAIAAAFVAAVVALGFVSSATHALGR
jgi:hypothetical protein